MLQCGLPLPQADGGTRGTLMLRGSSAKRFSHRAELRPTGKTQLLLGERFQRGGEGEQLIAADPRARHLK
ncbi:MAG: hypothetical protein AB7O56_15045 [Bauldia sp.]